MRPCSDGSPRCDLRASFHRRRTANTGARRARRDERYRGLLGSRKIPPVAVRDIGVLGSVFESVLERQDGRRRIVPSLAANDDRAWFISAPERDRQYSAVQTHRCRGRIGGAVMTPRELKCHYEIAATVPAGHLMCNPVEALVTRTEEQP